MAIPILMKHKNLSLNFIVKVTLMLGDRGDVLSVGGDVTTQDIKFLPSEGEKKKRQFCWLTSRKFKAHDKLSCLGPRGANGPTAYVQWYSHGVWQLSPRLIMHGASSLDEIFLKENVNVYSRDNIFLRI